jgi:NitT/TauT family transport system substrate-binding protein
MIPFLGQGRLDAGTGTLSAGFFNGLSEGLDITVVADSASVAPGSASHLSLVIHPNLSGDVADYADLAGLRIAINAPAGGLEVELARALELGGLTLDGVELVYLPFPEMIGAFSVDLIDAAILPEPFLTVGLSANAFVEFAPVGEFYPGHQISVLLFSAALADDRPTAARYLCAYLRGVADFRDALIERNRPADRVIEAIMKHTPIEDPALFSVMRYHLVARDGVPDLEAIAADLEYYRRAGYVESSVDVDAFVDLAMVQDAAASLD